MVQEAASQTDPGLRVAQFYRDNLVNFMISQGDAQ